MGCCVFVQSAVIISWALCNVTSCITRACVVSYIAFNTALPPHDQWGTCTTLVFSVTTDIFTRDTCFQRSRRSLSVWLRQRALLQRTRSAITETCCLVWYKSMLVRIMLWSFSLALAAIACWKARAYSLPRVYICFGWSHYRFITEIKLSPSDGE